MGKLNIGYPTKFKLKDRVRPINSQDSEMSVMHINAIQLSASEGDGLRVIYRVCWWDSNAGAFKEFWAEENDIKRV